MKQKIKFLLATIMMLVGVTATHAEDITSNIRIDVSTFCTDDNGTVTSYLKDEYTVKEGVVVTFRCLKSWDETVTIYLNGTAVATWPGDAGGSKYVWTAKKDAKINWKGYDQYSANIYLTETSTVDVTGITLDPATADMTVGGETLTLTPTVLPDNATDKTVTWTSSDESVATVANGVVTAVAPGTATITVTTTDGAKTATCTVTVAEPTYTVTVKEGTEDAASWTITPAEATTTGVAAGTEVKATYSGVKKVKSVKAVKKAAAWDGTITAQLAAKLAYTGGEIADFTDATDDLTTMTWAVGEHIAILYEVSGTKKVADAEITAVDGTTGAATITFTVEEGTPDNTPCTLVYPLSAAKDDHTGVKDAATLLAAQDGTLSANLDVRVGAGTIQTSTPGLTVTTQPEAQFAIFKFTTKSVPGEGEDMQNTSVTKLTVTTGGQDYVITPASATSTLYAALPAVDGQAVSFTATDGSNLYAASKASVSFAAAKYYQSTVKMGKVIEVFLSDNPRISAFIAAPSPSLNYLHIGLDQAYAIAKQLSTQNGGATVAVVYDNVGPTATYALSSDASATANTKGAALVAKNYRAFLATLWESAQ